MAALAGAQTADDEYAFVKKTLSSFKFFNEGVLFNPC